MPDVESTKRKYAKPTITTITSKAITTSGVNIFPPSSPVLDPGEYAVTTMIFCNVSGTSATLNLHLVETGASPSLVNTIMQSLTLPPGETFTFDSERFILADSDAVHAVASANSRLVATISYVRI